MSNAPHHREPFSMEEQHALAAWTAPPPPPHLVDHVLAQAGKPQQRRWYAGLKSISLAASLLLVLGVALLWWSWPVHEQGQHRSTERTTVRLGQHALVVAEGGTDLAWEIIGERTRVKQTSGNAFYRVDKGSNFTVHLPGSQRVDVKGTCFRTEVIPMKASRAGLMGAASGAALATAVLITVYEGRVLTATPQQELMVAAGQRARLEQDHPPLLLDETPAGQQPKSSAGTLSAGSTSEPRLVDGLHEENRKLAAETQRLRQEVQTLQGQLSQQQANTNSKSRFLDIPQEELLGMAKKCELRWDMPPMGSEPGQAEPRRIKELGLDQTEISAINSAQIMIHQQLSKELRRLYVEVTGDIKGAETLSPWTLSNEIDDKLPEDQVKQAFWRLAQERAGLLAPPKERTAATPAEQLYRLLTTAGDRLEKEIGEHIGPDLARRYREISGGFGSKSRSVRGCP